MTEGAMPTAKFVAKKELPLVKELTRANALYQAGQVEAAKKLYREILRKHPKATPVYHELGLIVAREGQYDQAIAFLEKALEYAPRNATILGNSAEVYRRAGRIDDAIDLANRALQIFRVYPEAINTLASALIARGDYSEARRELDKAIDFRPNYAEAYANLGDLYRCEGKLEEAAKAFRTALKYKPELFAATAALAEVLLLQGNAKQAIETLKKAIAKAPNDIRLLTNLGVTYGKSGENSQAISTLKKCIEAVPNFAQGYYNLGMAYLNDDRLDDASEAYATCFELRRGKAKPGLESLNELEQPRVYTADRDKTTLGKLEHDLEQLRFLREENLLAAAYDGVLAIFRETLEELKGRKSEHRQLFYSSQQKAKIGPYYNRALYYDPPGELESGAINPDLDFSEIKRSYLGTAPGITYFDDFLKPEALNALHRFSLESTVWFDYSSEGGYLGAHLSDGFACPLLFQIQRELRESLPGIFGGNFLRQLWGYKYDSRLTGMPLHADAAAVKVNFWTTPDSANLNPETGGLVVFDREAPLDWDFDAYNRDQEKIKAFLADSQGHNIPYRQNRAIIFNSNLFHRTADLIFKEGYENRRINITMLFGRRGDNCT